MTFFRYKEDRIPVAIIVSLFFFDLLFFFMAQKLLVVFSWAAFSFSLKLFICAWNHHHQHCPTFHQKFLNRLLEIVYTFHTGITTNVWVLHHNLGHHVNYLDQEKDESRWRRKDGTQMGLWEYTAVTAITGYYRSLCVGKKYPKYLTDLVGMGILNGLILLGLLWLNPVNATLIFVIPMLLAYIGTCGTTYFHHAGLETDDHLHASHNVVHPVYNMITGNLGYHTAHHMKQALHWSKLPEFHKTIADKIEPSLVAQEFPGLGGWLAKRVFNPLRERYGSKEKNNGVDQIPMD
jgi:fatty acid desaturase